MKNNPNNKSNPKTYLPDLYSYLQKYANYSEEQVGEVQI